MANLINKENLTIVVDTYTDGQTGQLKNVYKAIGELITMENNGETYQFGRLWGPTGSTEFKVFEQTDRKKALEAAGA